MASPVIILHGLCHSVHFQEPTCIGLAALDVPVLVTTRCACPLYDCADVDGFSDTGRPGFSPAGSILDGQMPSRTFQEGQPSPRSEAVVPDIFPGSTCRASCAVHSLYLPWLIPEPRVAGTAPAQRMLRLPGDVLTQPLCPAMHAQSTLYNRIHRHTSAECACTWCMPAYRLQASHRMKLCTLPAGSEGLPDDADRLRLTSEDGHSIMPRAPCTLCLKQSLLKQLKDAEHRQHIHCSSDVGCTDLACMSDCCMAPV